MRITFTILLFAQCILVPLATGLDFETRAPRISLNSEGIQMWQVLHRKTGAVLFQGENLTQIVQDNKSRFTSANMSLISIPGAQLSGTHFDFTVLHGTDLSRSDLSGCAFVGATLTEANLSASDLSLANLSFSDFDRSSLQDANLSSSSISDTTFRGCDLSGANLSKASIWRSDFEGADLRGAVFAGADFNVIWFEPSHLPEPESLEGVLGLRFIKVHSNFAPLEELRDRAYERGLRGIGSELTCSIQRNKNVDASRPWIQQFLSFYLFDATCAYGASPLRPLGILALILPFFFLIVAWNIRADHKSSRIMILHRGVNGDSHMLNVAELLKQGKSLAAYGEGMKFLWFSIFATTLLVVNVILGNRLAAKFTQLLWQHSLGLRAIGGLRVWIYAYSAVALFLLFLCASSFGRLFG